MLPLTNKAPQLLCLLKRLPIRAVEPGQLGGCPEHEDIDPLIRRSIVTQSPGDPAGGMLCIPGLEPRPYASLKLGDDLLSHTGVNVNSLGDGAGVVVMIRSSVCVSGYKPPLKKLLRRRRR
jgi:hypothetical protein